jgi:hypothetical protein
VNVAAASIPGQKLASDCDISQRAATAPRARMAGKADTGGVQTPCVDDTNYACSIETGVVNKISKNYDGLSFINYSLHPECIDFSIEITI